MSPIDPVVSWPPPAGHVQDIPSLIPALATICGRERLVALQRGIENSAMRRRAAAQWASLRV